MSKLDANFTSKDIELEELRIYTSTVAGTENLKFLLDIESISIFEDIRLPVTTGILQVKDARNLFSLMGINGTEFIKIIFKKPGDDSVRYEKTFRIYAVENREPVENSQVQRYAIRFCSEELIFSNQQLVSKSYKNNAASFHAASILYEFLKVPKNKLRIGNIEKSYGRSEFVFTTYKPIEAIIKLSEYAYSERGSTFLFFENSQGFNFKSLQNLLSATPITSLNYSTAKMVNDVETAAYENSNDMNKFVFNKMFNIIENTKKPLYAGTLYTLDLVRQKYSERSINIFNAIPPETRLDKILNLSDSKNRNRKEMFKEYKNNIKYSLTNFGQTNVPYMIERAYRENNTNVEEVLMQREMQLNALFNTSVKCVVPGNPVYTIGFTVNFNMPSFMPEDKNERKLDPFYSGKYLITQVRHTFVPGEGLQTSLELCKNSVLSLYDRSNDNKEYNGALRS